MSGLLEKVRSIPRGVETIREWLGTDDGACVPQELAQKRADVCLKCPRNELGGFVSEIVAEAVKRHLEIKSDLGMRVSGEKQLGRCRMCECQMRLKIWVPLSIVRKHLTPEQYDSAPTPCWQTEEKP